MPVISYEEARILVLASLRQWLAELPEAEKRRPRKVINFVPYSVLDLIRAVERDEIPEHVMDEAKLMGYVVE